MTLNLFLKFHTNYYEWDILCTVWEFDSLITVPKIVRADDFDISLQKFKRVNFLFWKLSPTTERKQMLHPKFVYGFPLSGEYWPSMNETTGLFTIIFKNFTLKQDRVLTASPKFNLDPLIFCKLSTNTRTPLHVYPSSSICSISPIAYMFFKSIPPSSKTKEGAATSLSFIS